MTRGRKSNASLEALLVDVRRKPIEPPADLQPGAASIFNQILASVEPHHFRKADVHLLASLSQAIFLARFYARLIVRIRAPSNPGPRL